LVISELLLNLFEVLKERYSHLHSKIDIAIAEHEGFSSVSRTFSGCSSAQWCKRCNKKALCSLIADIFL